MADVAMTWVDSTSHFFLLLQTVALWDLRNLKMKLHSFESHKDEIFQVCVCVCNMSSMACQMYHSGEVQGAYPLLKIL